MIFQGVKVFSALEFLIELASLSYEINLVEKRINVLGMLVLFFNL